ncbi:EAL domain-containing protein [Modestobacter sp. NPDC049651]|uniref:putative bifunctional diguanylate cyclase/phosphodiesterase n=1 Tax=unclassified Modestobacter TaxID=2643866 RepID=UPI0033DB2045
MTGVRPGGWVPPSAPAQDADELRGQLLAARLEVRDAYRSTAGLIRMLDVIGQGGAPAELAARALEAVSEVFSADLVLWVRATGDELDVVSSCGFGDAHEPRLPDLPGADGLFASPAARVWTAPAGQPPTVVAGVPVQSVVHVPVRVGPDRAAALVLLLSGGSGFDGSDLPLLQSVAERLRSSLEDAERRGAVEHLAAEGPVLARQLDRAPLFQETVRILADVTGAAWTSVVAVTDGRAHLETKGLRPDDDTTRWPRPVEELSAWADACRGAVHVTDDVAGALAVDLRGAARSLLAAPVLVDGEPVALLYAMHPRPGVFSSAAADAAQLLAGYVAAALVNGRLYRALSDSEQRLRVLTDAISDMVAVVTPDGTVGWASPSYRRGLGQEPAALVGRCWPDAVHPDDEALVRDALARCPQVTSVEHRVALGTGGWAWVETTLAPTPGDDGVVLSSRFVGDRRALEAELRRQATHDSLTGLANRALVRQTLAELVAPGHRADPVGVLFCDLDEFKAVNDRLGHEAGDDLLRQVADRLRECVRPGDLLARLGGDEFVVVLPDVTGDRALAAVGERVLAALHRPFHLGRETVRVGASVGGVLGRPGDAVTDLLRDADAAMYEAKRAGRGRVQVFDAPAAARSVERLSLRQEVQGALQRGELRVVHQPIVALASGRVEGFEALLRWRHPVHGDVPPDVFVPLAEETGAIGPIGDWVVREACSRLAGWHRLTGSDALTVSVNLSAVQLDDPGCVDRVLATLAAHRVPPGRLRLEVTENLEKTAAQLAQLHRLRGAGVSLVVDDFGVSYSNLAHLRDLPVDALKIDRSFVAALGDEPADQRRGIGRGIVRAVLALSEAAGLDVVAEGVETEEQRATLLSLGCRRGQGWLFAPGLVADDVTGLLVTGGVLGADAATV